MACSQEETHYLRLIHLTYRHGAVAARHFLNTLFTIRGYHQLSEWLAPKKEIIRSDTKFKNNKGGLIFPQEFFKLFPDRQGSGVSSENLDISLLTYLLDRFGYDSNDQGPYFEHNIDDASAKEWFKDALESLKILRVLRNKLAHNESGTVSQSEFHNRWETISECIRKLRPAEHLNIEDLKLEVLDRDATDRFTKLLKQEYEREVRIGFCTMGALTEIQRDVASVHTQGKETMNQLQKVQEDQRKGEQKQAEMQETIKSVEDNVISSRREILEQVNAVSQGQQGANDANRSLHVETNQLVMSSKAVAAETQMISQQTRQECIMVRQELAQHGDLVRQTLHHVQGLPSETSRGSSEREVEGMQLPQPPAHFDFGDGRLSSSNVDKILCTGVPNRSITIHKTIPRISQLAKEIISIWNTADRAKGFILIGIKPQPDFGGEVVGMSGTSKLITESDLQFSDETHFSNAPQFSVYEISYQDQFSNTCRLGVYEVASCKNYAKAPVAVLHEIQFLDGSRLAKNESSFWSRIGNEDVQINKYDASYRALLQWMNVVDVPKIDEKDADELTLLYNEQLSLAADKFQWGRGHGHYILITGVVQPEILKYYVRMLQIPWLLVLDFDSQDDGLLRMAEDLATRKVATVLWNEPVARLEEGSTSWVLMMGSSTEKNMDENHKKWFKNTLPYLKKIRDRLDEFSNKGRETVYQVIILWDNSSQHLDSHLEKLLEFFESNYSDTPYMRLIACSPRKLSAFDCSLDLQYIDVDMKTALATIWCDTSVTPQSSIGYLLPTKQQSKQNNPNFYSAEIQDIELTLDMLFLKSISTDDEEEIRMITQNFLRGTGLHWQSWYSTSDEFFSIKRSCFEEVQLSLRELLRMEKGHIEILHSPGGGCTTLAMQLLWSFHKEYPCGQVKLDKLQKLPVADQADRISEVVKIVHDRTSKPVLLFLDDPNESLVLALQRRMKEYIAVLLTTKRSVTVRENKLTVDCNWRKRFTLVGKFDKQESIKMIQHLCNVHPKKRQKFHQLQNAFLIEYCLAACCEQFSGLKKFVKNVYEELPVEQQEICKLLSFVDVFSSSGDHRSIELQRFSSLIDGQRGALLRDAAIENSMEYLVKPANSPDDSKVKMMHPLISEEILNLATKSDSYKSSHMLPSLAKKFIDFIVDDEEEIDRPDQQLLANIFTDRNSEDKGPYCKVIMDMRTLTQQREVFEKLRDTLIDDPHTQAHVARFYYRSCNDYEQAEKHFLKAVTLVEEAIAEFERSKSPGANQRFPKNPHHHTATLVYQMFALMDKSRVVRSLNDRYSEPDMQETVPLLIRSCKNFRRSREYTTGDSEHYFHTYLHDAILRLTFCEFTVNRKIFDLNKTPLSKIQRAPKWVNDAIEIVNESFDEVEYLISKSSQCVYNMDTTADLEIKNVNLRYKHLFHSIDLEAFEGGSLKQRRMWNTALKLIVLAKDGQKPVKSDTYGSFNNVEENEYLSQAVHNLELFLKEDCTDSRAGEKWVERDFQDYIMAIRSPKYPDTPLTKVLEIVDHCERKFPNIDLFTYYVAVIKFIIGIGSGSKYEDYPILIDALEKFEGLRQRSMHKKILKSKYAFKREWLGRSDRKEVKLMVRSFKGKPVHEPERCEGVVRRRSRNVHDHWDKISLISIGGKECPKKEDNSPIEAFFNHRALRQIDGRPPLSIQMMRGKRVEFSLAFTIDNGIEAKDIVLKH